MHLAVQAFIQAICPNPAFRKHGASGDDNDNDSDGDGDNDEWLNMDDIPDDEEEDAVDFEAGDLLGKILALINQVRLSCSTFLSKLVIRCVL